LRHPLHLRERIAQVHTAKHVQPLNAWVLGLRERLDDATSVPWFDPASGGVEARILFLLEAPGQKSVGREASLTKAGSGIISADNDDQTAENGWRLREEAGLNYDDVIHWNIVPWYVGTASKIASPGQSDIERAMPYLHEALTLLPRLEIVVLMGRKAQAGWSAYERRYQHELMAIPTWHPSARVFASNKAARRDILEALKKARAALLPLRP
jgi:uracil-DNA glycosylase